ncbi:carbohydrate porin [Salipiger pacificus]|nr:carbohydrate porin [Alloyangia pacifica]MCA0947448.1 carbohydrate porin [Alloyangia pacifica]
MPVRLFFRPTLLAALLTSASLPLAANAQDSGPQLSFGLTTFADVPTSGDTDDDALYNWRVDIKLNYAEIWSGGSITGHFEYNDGDGYVGLGEGGLVWPTNTFATLPSVTSDNDTTLSLSLTQQFNNTTSVSFGKFNVIDLAEATPLVGGQGQGGFQYLGIGAPGNFVLPPYIFGGMLTVNYAPMIYTLMIYDANNAQGEDFWDDLFDEGVVYNGTATYTTQINGMPGFYSFNIAHSTKKGTDYESLLLDPSDDAFMSTKDGVNYTGVSFQQYLWSDPQNPMVGWGVFGQIGYGDGNPNPLDEMFLLGIGGNSPLYGRQSDRWGLAWSKYNWSDKLGEALGAYGVKLQDESAVEAFYEAALTENWRLGGNVMWVKPSFESYDDYTQVGFRIRATF